MERETPGQRPRLNYGHPQAATRDSRGPASNSRAHFNRLQRKHKQSCGLSAKTLVRLWESLAEQVHDAGLVLGTRAAPPPRHEA